MLDVAELASHAEGFADALRAIGPASHEQVLAMLRVLRLDDGDAEAVLGHALAHGMVEADGDVLRATQRERAAPGVRRSISGTMSVVRAVLRKQTG